MLALLLPVLVGYHLSARGPSARVARCAASCAAANENEMEPDGGWGVDNLMEMMDTADGVLTRIRMCTACNARFRFHCMHNAHCIVSGLFSVKQFATDADAEASAQIQYGGIPHVAVIVGDRKAALKYYTEVLGMSDASSEPMDVEVPGACVRVGEQTIHLLETPTPDQHAQSATLHPWQCPSLAPAPPQGAPGSPVQLVTPRVRPQPLGSHPPPQLLELAASKVAHFTAFDR